MILLKNFQNIIYIDEKFLKTRIPITLQHKRAEVGSCHYRIPILVPQGSSFPLPKALGMRL